VSISLYPDQSELLESVKASMRRGHKAVLMQAATGSGKTIVSASMIAGTRNKGTHCMMLVPRREILAQTALTLQKYDMPFSYVAAGYPYNPHSKTYIGLVGTLVRRLDTAPKLDVLIVDECHFGAGELDKIIKHYKAQGTYIIGLSASPIRRDGRGMDCWFTDMVCGKSIRWLIDNNRLSDYKLFQPSRPDLSGLKNDKQVDDYMMEDRVLIGNAAHHYKTHVAGKLAVTFSTSREHSKKIVSEYRQNGIACADIDGTMDDAERIKIIRAFARREITQLVNCEICVFGFDLSAASGMDVCVEAITDLAHTKSLARQLQKWGRTLRYKTAPALIFDHCGNSFNHLGIRVHGFPCEERPWTLAGVKKGNRDSGEKAIPVRQCPTCFFCHQPAPKCPNCGFIYPIQSREIEHVEGELVEIKVGEYVQTIPKTSQKQYNYLTKVAKLPPHVALGVIRKQRKNG